MTSNHCADKTSKSTQLDKVSFAMDQFRLDSLDVFAAIVRCGGFRAAALERGVSSSALSQTINALEEALGIRLLNRTTRSVSPTEAGQRLLQRLGPALTDIRLAVDDLNQLKENPSGTLRINAPGPAIDHLLCPAMFTFMDTYPDIKVELINDAAVIDIVEQGFDAGVRFGKQLAQDMIAVPLGPSLRYAIVASPDYIAKHGTGFVVDRLVNTLFVQALRALCSNDTGKTSCWLAGLRDRRLARTIHAVHSDLARRWTVEDMMRCTPSFSHSYRPTRMVITVTI